MIAPYLQKIYTSKCGTMLPENKNEIDNSPQPPNIKYSGGTSDLPFSGYSYYPECCSVVLRIMSLKLERNDLI